MADERPAAPPSTAPRPVRRRGPRPPKPPKPPRPLPEWGKPERLTIGRVLAPHGIDGAIRIEILTDFPERIPALRRVYLGDEAQPQRVRRAQLHPPYALIWLAGFDDERAVEPYRGAVVRIDHDQAAPLPEGEYYFWQLIGATVVDETGTRLGLVDEILQTGANDVYIVRRPDGGELLLPAIKEVILAVDTERGVITVHLLPGLGE